MSEPRCNCSLCRLGRRFTIAVIKDGEVIETMKLEGENRSLAELVRKYAPPDQEEMSGIKVEVTFGGDNGVVAGTMDIELLVAVFAYALLRGEARVENELMDIVAEELTGMLVGPPEGDPRMN